MFSQSLFYDWTQTPWRVLTRLQKARKSPCSFHMQLFLQLNLSSPQIYDLESLPHPVSSVRVGAFLVPFCYPRAQPRALPRFSITTCVLKSLRARACGDVCMYTWACSPNWKSGLGHGRVQIIHVHSGSLLPTRATVLHSESPVCGLGMMVFISVQAPGKLVSVSTASQGSWES